MQYYRPRFELATLAPVQTKLVSKIGGVPWGLPHRLWPKCCGKPQKLLAQLVHREPMLDLGKEGHVLHLFQCLECLGIDNEQGRAAFIMPQAKLGDGLHPIPDYDALGALGGDKRLIGEAFIVGWLVGDEDDPETDPNELAERTRFGGSPRWTESGPVNLPPEPYEYLFQLDNNLVIDDLPPAVDEVGSTVWYTSPNNESGTFYEPREAKINAPWHVRFEEDGTQYSFSYTNLGSDGTIYVFIDRTQSPPAVKWFWNR